MIKYYENTVNFNLYVLKHVFSLFPLVILIHFSINLLIHLSVSINLILLFMHVLIFVLELLCVPTYKLKVIISTSI